MTTGSSWAGDLAADRARAMRLVPVSRETATRLDSFIALLLKWQETTNLVAASTLGEIWTRHVADSLQLVPLAPNSRVWVDLGSGGGFPGLAIACALAETGATVHLVESNAKKAAFLREAVRKIGLPALVHAQRIEDFVHRAYGPVDTVTARALAPVAVLLDYAEPLLNRGAQALFLKGQDVESELTQAARYWSIVADLIPSRTASSGRIVAVRAARRC
jgi:16S rRNA (guanine527-N7)-methyltransferase